MLECFGAFLVENLRNCKINYIKKYSKGFMVEKDADFLTAEIQEDKCIK